MGAVAVLAGLASYFLAVTIPLPEPARLAMNSVEEPVFEEAVVEKPKIDEPKIEEPLPEEPRIGPAAGGEEAPQANVPDELSEAEIESQLESESMAMDLRLALAQAGPYVSSRAWKSLYRLWGVQSSAVSDEQACAQAPAAGLRCLQGGGSWTVLKHFDRPALLLLVAAEGRRVPVLIREVVGSQVRVQLDGRDLEVPFEELERRWFGEYRLLWKAPPNGNAALRPGDRNADVKWLRDRLAKATGLTAIAPDPLYFDTGLKQLVQSFQRNLELSADGVAGARTFINLNNLDRTSSVPRLGAVTASR